MCDCVCIACRSDDGEAVDVKLQHSDASYA